MCAIEMTRRIAAPRPTRRGLRLREPRLRDAGRITDLANDLVVAATAGTVLHPYAKSNAEAFLSRYRDRARQALFAIDHPQDGVIGMLGFRNGDYVQPELGYWLGRDYWGQGYATEATNAALIWASEDWGKRCVRASHRADNAASAAVLCKAGFLYTGDVSPAPALRGDLPPSRHMVWLA